jgi:hypothetical protein
MEAVSSRPVTDQALERLHARELQRFYREGKSDLVTPTRVNTTAIVVGAFPDLLPVDRDANPVLTDQEQVALAGQIRDACGVRVDDLDRFRALGRRFMLDHPTVRIVEFPLVSAERTRSRLPPRLHDALFALERNGDVSPVLAMPGAAYVLRRGVTFPGRGESVDAVREELTTLAREEASREAYRGAMARLKRRYRARTWPTRLERPPGDGSRPRR